MKHWQQALTEGRLPVELDIGDAALLVDEGVGVHAKALHVAVVQRDADVVLQEGELQTPDSNQKHDTCKPSSSLLKHDFAWLTWHAATSARQKQKGL